MKSVAGPRFSRVAIVVILGVGCGGQMGGGSPGIGGSGGSGTRDGGRDSAGGNAADASASGGGRGGTGGSATGGAAGGAAAGKGGGGAGAKGGAGGAAGGGAQGGAPGGRCTAFQFLQPSHSGEDAIFADMNKDGRLDVVAVWTAAPSGAYVSHFVTYQQTSPRVFADPAEYLFNVYNFNRVATYDLDQDGVPDIAASNQNGSVGLLLSGAGYAAGAPLRPMSNEMMFDVVAADFDGDGYGDIAVPLESTNATIGIYWGTGGGAFSARNDYTFCKDAVHAAVIDANEDGRPDLAVSCQSSGSQVLINQGSRKFTATLLAGTTQGFALATGDLNHDGHVDVVVPDFVFKQALVYLGDGHGNFTVPTGLLATTSAEPSSGAIGDLDGDGNADLVLGDFNQATIAFYKGTGDGHFQAAKPFPMGSTTRGLAIADVDGDGYQDLMVNTGPTIIYGPCP
jgi:hypothetical protein